MSQNKVNMFFLFDMNVTNSLHKHLTLNSNISKGTLKN